MNASGIVLEMKERKKSKRTCGFDIMSENGQTGFRNYSVISPARAGGYIDDRSLHSVAKQVHLCCDSHELRQDDLYKHRLIFKALM